MTTPDNPHRAQLALLVQLLSFVGREECEARWLADRRITLGARVLRSVLLARAL